MHWRLNAGLVLALCLVLLAAPLCAAPPAAIPNYGGRDSAPLETGANAPNPAAQAGRAVEALVLVLLGVGGVIYAMKRFGLVQPGADGKAARINFAGLSGLTGSSQTASGESSPVTVVASQTLPGGTALHLVTIRGRTLLLGATPQSVQTLAEWREALQEEDETLAFEAYLARADADAGKAPDSASPLSAANARLRSLLDRQKE